MILTIHDNLLVQDLQLNLSNCFPNLKIQFYKQAHYWEALSIEGWIEPKTKIADLRKIKTGECIEIKADDPVRKVENAFKYQFGLNVRIFRNEENEWIHASSDSCTLQELNDLGKYAPLCILPKAKKRVNEYRLYL